CLMHRQGYSSSFNLFAVIIGIFLMRGSLRTTTLVIHFSAFMLTLFIGIIFLFPFIQPTGLILAQAKLNPLSSAVSWLMAVAVLALLVWTYRQMRSQPVREARIASGRTTTMPKIAIGFGIVLVVFMAVMLNMTLNGAIGAEAIELARKKLGPDYKYATQSIRASGKHRSGIVAAYNDKEIKYVPVHWSE
ncbi:MAG: hypothetical protein K0U82_06695, partial [Planctomycetes bacterium]|nr:hypothetical protein [Planctomycetota bacterium]